MSRERWVRRMWRGEGGVAGGVVSLLLLPLSSLYRLGTGLRGLAYGLGVARSHEAAIPVVSVGNLSVGGTGKTPLTRWVVAHLRAAGVAPAVVLRGYGADEVRLHERWAPEVPVVADADRVAAVARAVEVGAEVAVLDDGFQHRRLARDLDIVLLAAEEPFPGRVLPRGAYREAAAALDRADIVVVTRKRAGPEVADEVEAAVRRLGLARPVVRVQLRPARVRTLADWAAGATGAGEARPEGPIRVASGVGDPDSVVDAARALGMEVADRVDFGDHHDFTAEEVARLRAGPDPLVVTEKDAIKLQRWAVEATDVFVLEQEVVVERGGELLVRLLDAVVARVAAGGSGGAG